MNILRFVSRLFEKRAQLDNSRYRAEWFSGESTGDSATASGVRVTADNALSVSAVYACVRILSETLASLPLILYKRLPDGKERAVDHPLYNVLHNSPNRWQTSFEWREAMQAHLSLRGNAYSEILHNGRKIELIPIFPDSVIPRMDDNGRISYEINGKTRRIIPQEKMLHLRFMTLDGLNGISPIQCMRETIGLAKSEQMHSAITLKNNARPSGTLNHPLSLSESAIKNLRESWKEIHGGDNRGNVAILDEGIEYKPLSMTFEDIQLIESRKFSIEEICRFYRIPMHLVQSLDKSSFNNITHQSLEFVIYTMLPWFTRWEQAISRDLLSDADRGEYFVEFLVDGLLRGDIESRYKSYAIGRNGGWLSANDIRKMENMNPIENGDIYLEPLNMVEAGNNQNISNPSPKDENTPTNNAENN